MRSLLLLTATAALSAMDVGIDHADTWYSPKSSHHGYHFAGGLAIGLTVGAATRVVTDDTTASYVVAIGSAACAGTWHEWSTARDGALFDSVDIAWTVVGSAVGCALANLTHDALTIRASRDEVAIAGRLTF